jgi:hypothetical protein
MLFFATATIVSAPLTIWTLVGSGCSAPVDRAVTLLRSPVSSPIFRKAKLSGPGGACWIADHFAWILSRYLGSGPLLIPSRRAHR